MAGGNFGGGDGTENNPYLVEDAQDLNAIHNYVSTKLNATKGLIAQSFSTHFKQVANIDLSAYAPWTPIGGDDGSDDYYFYQSTYDGGNFEITGVEIRQSAGTSEYHSGLFGYARECDIKNVRITGEIHGDLEVGLLIGSSKSCNVHNCHATLTASSTNGSGYGSGVGGLIGDTNVITGGVKNKVTNCSATGNLWCTNIYGVGLIVGSGYNLDIEYCTAEGIAEGDGDVGGLCGTLYIGGTAKKCFANVDIRQRAAETGGGLIGQVGSNNLVEDCYATAPEVKGYTASSRKLGGLIGEISGNDNTIRNCYARSGKITGDGWTAGLIGYIQNPSTATVQGCFVIDGTGLGYSGAVKTEFHRICQEEANITDCYVWSGYMSYGNPTDGIALPTSRLAEDSIYIESGWDFQNVWGIDETWSESYYVPRTIGYPAPNDVANNKPWVVVHDSGTNEYTLFVTDGYSGYFYHDGGAMKCSTTAQMYTYTSGDDWGTAEPIVMANVTLMTVSGTAHYEDCNNHVYTDNTSEKSRHFNPPPSQYKRTVTHYNYPYLLTKYNNDGSVAIEDGTEESTYTGTAFTSRRNCIVVEKALPGEGTMSYGGYVYKYLATLDNGEAITGTDGESAVHTFYGNAIESNGKRYKFIASGITDSSAPGGYGNYTSENSRTVPFVDGYCNTVNFYYVEMGEGEIAYDRLISFQDSYEVIGIPLVINSDSPMKMQTETNTTTGVPLVPVTDNMASYIRIQTPTGTKALQSISKRGNLRILIEEAQNYANSDGRYTTETWTNLQTQITSAQNALTDNTADIDYEMSALNSRMAELAFNDVTVSGKRALMIVTDLAHSSTSTTQSALEGMGMIITPILNLDVVETSFDEQDVVILLRTGFDGTGASAQMILDCGLPIIMGYATGGSENAWVDVGTMPYELGFATSLYTNSYKYQVDRVGTTGYNSMYSSTNTRTYASGTWMCAYANPIGVTHFNMDGTSFPATVFIDEGVVTLNDHTMTARAVMLGFLYGLQAYHADGLSMIERAIEWAVSPWFDYDE